MPCQHCLLAEGDIGAPIFTSAKLTVWSASTIFKPIVYKLSFTIRKRKYFEGKTTATLKIKQTSIATVRNHILTVACFPTDSQNFLFFFIYLNWGKGKNKRRCRHLGWRRLVRECDVSVHPLPPPCSCSSV